MRLLPPPLLLLLAAASLVQVAVASAALFPAQCLAAMTKACEITRSNPGDCFTCMSTHQAALKAANCTEADFSGFCLPGPNPPPRHDCTTNLDCNQAGRCTHGRFGSRVCFCDYGWWGQFCDRIKFQSSSRCGSGGLCLDGAAQGRFTSTWGGEAVRADDGSYHMFAAAFDNNSTLSSWLQQSRVVHAKSTTGPLGPYTFVDVALGRRPLSHWDGLTQHNPAIQRDPVEGTWLLYCAFAFT
jgi:hypothetical protein